MFTIYPTIFFHLHTPLDNLSGEWTMETEKEQKKSSLYQLVLCYCHICDLGPAKGYTVMARCRLPTVNFHHINSTTIQT